MASIPLSLLNDLERVPRDRRAALLMRHSARHPIVDPDQPYVAMLTEEGIKLAEELGATLGQSFAQGRLMSAPVARCQETALAIARGAGWMGAVSLEEYLSHPFIAPVWDRLSRGEDYRNPPKQVRLTLDLLLDNAEAPPGLDVAVTHDTIVIAVVGALLKAPFMEEFWPDYLEGVFLWRDGDQVQLLWRGEEYCFGTGYRKQRI